MDSVFEALNAGQINWLSGLLALASALVAGVIGGAVGGVIVGGKHMGNELAALLGGFYGPMAAVPGVVVALLIVAFT